MAYGDCNESAGRINVFLRTIRHAIDSVMEVALQRFTVRNSLRPSPQDQQKMKLVRFVESLSEFHQTNTRILLALTENQPANLRQAVIYETGLMLILRQKREHFIRSAMIDSKFGDEAERFRAWQNMKYDYTFITETMTQLEKTRLPAKQPERIPMPIIWTVLGVVVGILAIQASIALQDWGTEVTFVSRACSASRSTAYQMQLEAKREHASAVVKFFELGWIPFTCR